MTKQIPDELLTDLKTISAKYPDFLIYVVDKDMTVREFFAMRA